MTKSLADYRKLFLQLKLSLANYLLFQKILKSDHVYHKGKIVIGNHVQIYTAFDPDLKIKLYLFLSKDKLISLI